MSCLLEDDADHSFVAIFAAYLKQFPEVEIDYNGVLLDPKNAQLNDATYTLGDFTDSSGKQTSASLEIIEWKVPTKRRIYLCDESGMSLAEVEIGPQIKAPGYEFTAYLKTPRIRELDADNRLILLEADPEVNALLNEAKTQIKKHFQKREDEKLSDTVERWKRESIYPFQNKDSENSLEIAERQVFDILAVNVERHLPSFAEADVKSKRFTFRLLYQAIQENPDSVQEIISEVLGLKKESQDDLAHLLKRTPLSSIISSAKVVANRLDFLVGLENLIFDKKTKKTLLERDQLHKILEKESWIFREEFALAGSELRLEEVLEKHRGLLGNRGGSVKLSDGKGGRVVSGLGIWSQCEG